MRRTLPRAAALSLMLATAATQVAAAPVSRDEAAIREALNKWTDDANHGRWAEASRVWAPGVIGWYPGQPDFDDASVEKGRNRDGAKVTGRYRLKIDEVLVDHRLAVVRDEWWREGLQPDGSWTLTSYIRGFEVWRKQADGSWKIIRWLSAPDKPPADG